ncbi:MAG: hypothetical protein ACOYOZ_09445 [Pirellula sp.]
MTATIITEERNITNALISGLANLSETPTREQVEEKAKQIADIFGYTGDLRNIITEAMISVDTRMGAGVSLVDFASKHDDQWVRKREDITWTYAGAYENFLLKDSWPPRMVQSLSDVTSRILGHLQDPQSEGTTWSRRGLVIGHVQSGKTANYTGLMARAADAGYKFIVVIAGIHNNPGAHRRSLHRALQRSRGPQLYRRGSRSRLPAPGNSHQYQRGLQQEHCSKERLEDQRLLQADYPHHQKECHDPHSPSQLAEGTERSG